MYLTRETDIEPGDIVFVVNHSSDITSRAKRGIQSLPTANRKQGHKEVVSVFVCTESDPTWGIVGYNQERRLEYSTKHLEDSIHLWINQEWDKINFSGTEKQVEDKKIDLLKAHFHDLSAKMNANTTISLDNVSDLKSAVEKYIELIKELGIKRFFIASNQSFIVFKFTRDEQRQAFLEKYKNQQELTDLSHKEKKSRTSASSILSGIFKSANQDKIDQSKNYQPSRETHCSRNVIEVLNQVDPTLVKRGRNILPRTLEAGFRASLGSGNPSLTDIFDEQAGPAFEMRIYPQLGKALMKELMSIIDTELNKLQSKKKLLNVKIKSTLS